MDPLIDQFQHIKLYLYNRIDMVFQLQEKLLKREEVFETENYDFLKYVMTILISKPFDIRFLLQEYLFFKI